jgi:hypothetical protein
MFQVGNRVRDATPERRVGFCSMLFLPRALRLRNYCAVWYLTSVTFLPKFANDDRREKPAAPPAAWSGPFLPLPELRDLPQA